MKLILKQLLILSFALTFISGCSSQKNIQGRIIDISFSVLEQKINKKEDFILQFSKRNCPHCLLLEKTEKEFLRKNEIKIFRFQIDENQKDFNENQEFIISNFPDLDMVPSVYWMEKGRAENQLPIIEEDQYLVLKKWITDNQNYYKGGG